MNLKKLFEAFLKALKKKPTKTQKPAPKKKPVRKSVKTDNMEGFLRQVHHLFPNILTSQRAGIEAILAETKGLLPAQRAYLLATAYHETAFTMEPITEYGRRSYFDKYDVGRIAVALGNTPQRDGDGYRYRGRGYVQMTGTRNYQYATDKLGVDFINNPALALDEHHAATLLVMGCMEGWWTGRPLTRYINEKKKDYYNARRVVNGTDRASAIAEYAVAFERAIGKL